MMYLSKGAALRPQRGGVQHVSRCGKVFALGPELASLWYKARIMPKPVPADRERAIRRLAEAGLVSVTDEEGDLGAYRLIIDCVLCPSHKFRPRLPLRGRDRRLWAWITRAGLRLTAGELIRLEELEAVPGPELLGEDGRQSLTETIYLSSSIFDGILDAQMEHSHARDATVASILKLVSTHRLLLI